LELIYSQTKRKEFSKEIKPVYLIEGDEEFLKEKVLKKIISFTSKNNPDIEQLEGEEISPDNLFNSLNTLPFLSNFRIVIIRDAQKISKEVENLIIKYLKNPNPVTSLILITRKEIETERIEKCVSEALRNIIKICGYIINCKLKTEAEFKEFVNDYLTEYGKKMEQPALSYFLGLAGKNLYNINSELEKLITYAGERIVITKEDVEKIVIKYPETFIFELIDAISNKNLQKALDSLEELLKRKNEKPEKILGMIARQFRLIWQAKFLIRKGYISLNKSISQQIKMLPEEIQDKILTDRKEGLLFQREFVIEKTVRQSLNFDYERLSEITGSLFSADLSIKDIKEGKDPKTALELLILDLCK
jgi:DNA polymerase-3 subunit delta